MIGICVRCKEEKELCCRVKSDILNDLVCAACANAALDIDHGLEVEMINEEGGK